MKTSAEQARKNREKSLRHYWRNPSDIRARQRARRLNNIVVEREKDKKKRARNIEACRAATRAWRKKNPSAGRVNVKEWRKKNPTHFKTKYRADPEYRLTVILRARLGIVMRSLKTSKVAPTLGLLGCSVACFRRRIESLFRPGMTWKNHGPVWHLDHKKPCAAFDLTNATQQKLCFHWTNLQPLFAKENLHKSKTYPT